MTKKHTALNQGQAAALPETNQAHTMNTSIKQPMQPLPSEIWSELYILKNIIGLAAFAADARRTLEGIDEVRRWYPDIDKSISDRVEASNNWTMCKDTIPEVLDHVSDRLGSLLAAEEIV